MKHKHKKMEPLIIDVSALPESPFTGVWYHFNGNYWFVNSDTGEWVNGGGDRPTKPPVNP